MSFSALGADAAEPPKAAAASTPSLRMRLSDGVVRQAVRDTLADNPAEPGSEPTGRILSGDRYQSFARTFSEAQKPSCLGPDALKHQPNKIDTKHGHFEANGTMALPFWAAAIMRGKCN